MRIFHGLRAGLVGATLRETGGTGGGERRSNLLASNQEYAWLRLENFGENKGTAN